MAVVVGPADWWVATPGALNSLAIACPVGTVLPDGSVSICKAGGTVWIIAPISTEASQSWNNNSASLVGNKPCVSDWPTVCSKMITSGFNPSDWCIPSASNLNNPGYICRSRWDSFTATSYWSSTETSASNACRQNFSDGALVGIAKTNSFNVRAFRTVNY
jgi:hypothetical protein